MAYQLLISTHVVICACIHLYIYICVCLCVLYIYIYIYICVFVCFYTYIYIYIYIYIYLCVCVFFICISIFVYLCSFLSIYVSVYVCECVCMFRMFLCCFFRSTDGDTDYFDIEAGVLQEDTLGPYLFIICLYYVLRTSIDLMEKKNAFKLAKKRSRRYPAQTISDPDYADNIALLRNSIVQAKFVLHSLERTAGNIGVHVNADKTEYMCFCQMGDICTLKAVLWNEWTSSTTSEEASHQLRMTSTRY